MMQVKNLDPLDARLRFMIQQLSPAGRRDIMRDIARQLKTSQRTRITANIMPDGEAMIPRRNPLRTRKGQIKRNQLMFQKIAGNKNLRSRSNSGAAVLKISGRAAQIARVSQYGLRDRPSPRQRLMSYDKRPLLGFSEQDRHNVRQQILGKL